jgi:hypothetical protein
VQDAVSGGGNRHTCLLPLYRKSSLFKRDLCLYRWILQILVTRGSVLLRVQNMAGSTRLMHFALIPWTLKKAHCLHPRGPFFGQEGVTDKNLPYGGHHATSTFQIRFEGE